MIFVYLVPAGIELIKPALELALARGVRIVTYGECSALYLCFVYTYISTLYIYLLFFYMYLFFPFCAPPIYFSIMYGYACLSLFVTWSRSKRGKTIVS